MSIGEDEEEQESSANDRLLTFAHSLRIQSQMSLEDLAACRSAKRRTFWMDCWEALSLRSSDVKSRRTWNVSSMSVVEWA